MHRCQLLPTVSATASNSEGNLVFLRKDDIALTSADFAVINPPIPETRILKFHASPFRVILLLLSANLFPPVAVMDNKKSKVKDEELEEEMKMDKFYSLLRSFRDARDRRRKQLDELEQNDKKKRKLKITKQETTSSSWVPSFEREDFTTEVEFRRPPLVFPTPCDRIGATKKEAHEDDTVDLKLTL